MVECSPLGDLNDSITKMGFQVESRGDSELGAYNTAEISGNDGLQSQDSFGRWINCITTDSLGSVDDALLESPLSHNQYSSGTSPIGSQQSPGPGNIFSITDISPSWAFSNEKTKVLSSLACRRWWLIDLSMQNFLGVCKMIIWS